MASDRQVIIRHFVTKVDEPFKLFPGESVVGVGGAQRQASGLYVDVFIALEATDAEGDPRG